MRDAVLFIHSTGTMPSMWQPLIKAAALPATVLSPANLGYPPNAPLARGSDFHWSQDAAHLRAQIPAEAERVHLVAHSYGGLLAYKLALELGPRLGSLWQYEPVMFGSLQLERANADADTAKELDWFYEHEWFIADAARGGTAEWQEIFIDYWNRPGAWQSMPAPMQQAMLAVGWKMYQEVRATSGDATPFYAYRLTAPVTLAVGSRSPASPRAMAQALVRESPQTRIDVVEGVGHMGPLLKPMALLDSFKRHFDAVLA